ncbi:MAG: MATE family efflux transporter [Synergistaceae bacterium]|jgi:putative MATE family efflux protein|nr:MATE family efflux transporter [Synergistaceae bacterium]
MENSMENLTEGGGEKFNGDGPAERRPENKMGVMSVHRLLLSMSVPMVISMLVQALYNVVDSIFVAQISENALTAVSLAFPIQSLIIGVGVGTGVGMNAFLSKSLGEKNFATVNKSAMNGIFLAWMTCAVFMILGFAGSEAFFRSQTDISEIVAYGRDYLSIVCVFSFGVFNQIMFERLLASTGKTFYSMISQMTGAVTNIILDPIMIFGLLGFPRMEVAGAALATVIGQTAGACLALWFNLRKNHEIKLSVKGFRPDLGIMKRIYAVGLPSILMASLGSVMTYGLNRILISFTPTATAVFGVYFKLQSFVFMPVFGLNNGMVPIIAYNFGARKKERIIGTIRLSLMYAVGIMLLGLAVFHIFPHELLRMFNATPEMIAIGVPALRIISLHFLFAGFCIVSLSVFQALGNGMESLFVAGSRQLLLLLPAAWLLSLTGFVNATWWSFPIAEGATLVLCVIFLRRVYNKKVKII